MKTAPAELGGVLRKWIVGLFVLSGILAAVIMAEQPIDTELLAEVQKIFEPVHNWHHIEGCPTNNDGQ